MSTYCYYLKKSVCVPNLDAKPYPPCPNLRCNAFIKNYIVWDQTSTRV